MRAFVARLEAVVIATDSATIAQLGRPATPTAAKTPAVTAPAPAPIAKTVHLGGAPAGAAR